MYLISRPCMIDAVWLKSGLVLTLFINLSLHEVFFIFNLIAYCVRSCIVLRLWKGHKLKPLGWKKAVNSDHTEQPTQSGTATWITSHSLLLHTPYHVAWRMGLNNIQWLGPDAERLLISYAFKRADLYRDPSKTTAIFLHLFTLNLLIACF